MKPLSLGAVSSLVAREKPVPTGSTKTMSHLSSQVPWLRAPTSFMRMRRGPVVSGFPFGLLMGSIPAVAFYFSGLPLSVISCAVITGGRST